MGSMAQGYVEAYHDSVRVLDDLISRTRDKHNLDRCSTQVELFMPEAEGAMAYSKPGKIFFGVVSLLKQARQELPMYSRMVSKDLLSLWNYRGIPESVVLGSHEPASGIPWFNAASLISLGAYVDVLDEASLPHALEKLSKPSCVEDVRAPEMLSRTFYWVGKNANKLKRELEVTYVHEAAHLAVYEKSDLPVREWQEAMEPLTLGSTSLPSLSSVANALRLDLEVTPAIEGIAIGTAAKLCNVRKKDFKEEIESFGHALNNRYAIFKGLYTVLGVDERFPATDKAEIAFKRIAKDHYKRPLSLA